RSGISLPAGETSGHGAQHPQHLPAGQSDRTGRADAARHRIGAHCDGRRLPARRGRRSMSRILVFDSGVGGLTVLDAIRVVLPDASYVYVADNDGFPYGEWDEDDLIARTVALFDQLVATWSPGLCVIACNTASTRVLPPLRARFAMPFAGTVPAIKAAAKLARSGLARLLATPGTMKREYTRALIRTFATHVAVRLVGCHELAPIAEAKLAGRAVDMDAVRMEIAPAFLDTGGRRTDTVVLACTHYPLILDDLRA